MTWAAIGKLLAALVKAIMKPITGGFALLAARYVGRTEAEKDALVEHAKKVEAANIARADGELKGLQPEDYRD